MGINVVVTGIGIISALGKGVEVNKKNIFLKDSFIGYPEFLRLKNKEIVAGEVKYNDDELQKFAKLSKKFSRTSMLSIIAVQEAVEDAGYQSSFSNKEVAIVSSSTVGGIREIENRYKKYILGDLCDPYLDSHEGASITEDLARLLNINQNVSINTACSSSLNSIMLGARMIKNGICDVAIVGGSDALSKYTLNGFNSLFLLDKDVCSPFDRNRKGINLGEAAGYLILESEESAKSRNKIARATISGYGNANDAFHATSSSSEVTGLCLAMEKSLQMGKLKACDIDYINAHGTGTRNNDITEIAAMKKIFDQVPIFSSTKSKTGHCLAAAGVIESIFSIFALQMNKPIISYNFSNPMDDDLLTPYTGENFDKDICHVMNNSIAMGGFCSSLIFSKV
ncbi:beta-ketoacyl-[acyl-carrier-protein] synthase family protein [Myroides odoratus]|uniref:beta-ketoacyl-[acyl-carrier-protein] synthase family protein n=1 Tax=Myroides odoratus TaxID=256 RepID=UPI0039AEB6A5